MSDQTQAQTTSIPGIVKSTSSRAEEAQKEHPDWTDEQCRVYAESVEAIEDLIPFVAKVMPKLGNKGASELVDIAGGQNALRKQTDKLEKLLKGIIDIKTENNDTRGERYQLTYVSGGRTALDQTKAKGLLDALDTWRDQLDEAYKLSEAGGDPTALQHRVKLFLQTFPVGAFDCMSSSEGVRRTFTRLSPSS